jgi:hypothetical protein
MVRRPAIDVPRHQHDGLCCVRRLWIGRDKPVRRSTHRRPVPLSRSAFAGFRFPAEVITVAVRWAACSSAFDPIRSTHKIIARDGVRECEAIRVDSESGRWLRVGAVVVQAHRVLVTPPRSARRPPRMNWSSERAGAECAWRSEARWVVDALFIVEDLDVAVFADA